MKSGCPSPLTSPATDSELAALSRGAWPSSRTLPGALPRSTTVAHAPGGAAKAIAATTRIVAEPSFIAGGLPRRPISGSPSVTEVSQRTQRVWAGAHRPNRLRRATNGGTHVVEGAQDSRNLADRRPRSGGRPVGRPVGRARSRRRPGNARRCRARRDRLADGLGDQPGGGRDQRHPAGAG